MERSWITIEGNEAAAAIAYALSEVIAIYPITPSTPMGELADAWSASGRPNLWGTVPQVTEMQSEGGAAGAIHGALQTGALATTFTASQGLLLMIPNMYKIAGELTPVVFHVAARSLAAQGLSIFGDHSDVMATRATGFALLASNSVQEAQDLALIAHASTLQTRVPFLHFFDGFRTSHEIDKIEQVTHDDIRAMIDDALVRAHRARALSPEHPVIRGTAQNPDVYFQARETVNTFYQDCPDRVQQAMNTFASLTGRQYHLFDYVGAPDAERVIVAMGSGAETAQATADYLTARGEKVGVLKVHLFRPFSLAHFVAALPPTTRSIAVLDRTKEPGSTGEPLYLDVVAALNEARVPALSSVRIIGGRYGLSSKEFTPAMVKGIYDEMRKEEPKNHFTIGILDDVTHTSLDYDPSFSIEGLDIVQCVFWGLGSDGTVGANKNSIKIIGEETANYAQGYFVYDSKKSGSVTISHLRFGPHPFSASYLIGAGQADFVACHQFAMLERFDVLKYAKAGAVFLLDSIYKPEEVWKHLPSEVQQEIQTKHLRFYVIDAHKVANLVGMGGRINTIMQTCFFAISGILPEEQAILQIKQSIKKTYGKRGEAVVQKNFKAVDETLVHLHTVAIPLPEEAELEVVGAAARSQQARRTLSLPMLTRRPPVPEEAPEFVRHVLGPMIAGEGDTLPVSALPFDGTYPVGTTRWEKRNIAQEIPTWDPDICIQCGKCVMVCPHAVIRMKVYARDALQDAPATFLSADARFKEFPDTRYTLQVSPEDCTGCSLCVEACPVKDKRQVGRKAINMAPQPPLREQEVANWDYFLKLPEVDTTNLNIAAIKNSQLLEPFFEFSGACSGCGETPYIKLVTQLFGDHMVVANATGCSSIYGGNLPTTPWTANSEGHGPAWSNSLFEDNAEFGLGMRVTLDRQQSYATELLARYTDLLGDELAQSLLHTNQGNIAGIRAQRERVALLKQHIQQVADTDPVHANEMQNFLSVADALIRRSVWIIGGDGWAYDIGYGGLDHVLASGRNVNVLVLDTEVYSNTGGQASKSTPRGAVAKFAAQGKATRKKDLGMLAMAYGNVYVARIAMGANDQQTLRAILEAEAYDGPSLIIAYSHCIAHGIEMSKGLEQQKLAVQTGYWPLYRYNPTLLDEGKNPLILDSKEPTLPLEAYIYNETRYRMLVQSNKERADSLLQLAKQDVQERVAQYQRLVDEHDERVR
ncbi:MAG TPA: pyruvate:ferredoxin (flavodoxin) oxidoreductase [Ktedonobacteraceae bacterium]|jgi:pyruvate-ferredoxin/flavodoxin oxidoreductase|nr:pyruvate:ferredoxin (flavodoxin) oxidoreductase [Ktedonobacteraceae bacterium]